MYHSTITSSVGRTSLAALLGAMAVFMAALTGCASGSSSAEKAASVVCQTGSSLGDYSQRALLGVGYEALQSGNLSCAERLFAEANRFDPKDPWALLNLGVARHRQGKLDQARLAYQMAAAVDPVTSGIQLESQAISTQKQEQAVVASRDAALKNSPGEIALENLKLIR